MIEILLALIAGMLTIAAPCILLPLPILLGSSVGRTSRTRPLFITLGFVVTFSLLAITLNTLVQNLGVDPNVLRTAAALLLALFAVFMIWPLPFEKLSQHMSGLINRASQTGQHAGTGNWGGFIMGVVIGVIWAPCAGPILASILTLIAQETNTAKAFGLLISYSIGAGIPMLLIAYGGQAITTKVRVIARYATRLQQIFGILLLGVALAIHFNYDTKIQAWLVERLPTLNSTIEDTILNKIENEDSTKKTREESANGLLENYGQAPELRGITSWLNSNPLTVSELQGKVVLIDFWTYSCINCVRTLPHVTKWHDTYKDQGLVIIGVHTPEFVFEKSTENVRRAIEQHGIQYPIAQDNNYTTWLAYDNRYWPAKYLIDREGALVYTHFGEGDYAATETAIRTALGLTGVAAETDRNGQIRKAQTPEIYLGTKRLEFLTKSQSGFTAESMSQSYSFPNNLELHHFALAGVWDFEDTYTKLTENNGTVKLRFQGSKVYMVAESRQPQTISVRVPGYETRTIVVQNPTLYTLFDSNTYGEYTMEITVPAKDFDLYTFTFGQ